MGKRFKGLSKALSLILSLAMVVTCLPAPVYAYDNDLLADEKDADILSTNPVSEPESNDRVSEPERKNQVSEPESDDSADYEADKATTLNVVKVANVDVKLTVNGTVVGDGEGVEVDPNESISLNVTTLNGATIWYHIYYMDTPDETDLLTLELARYDGTYAYNMIDFIDGDMQSQNLSITAARVKEFSSKYSTMYIYAPTTRVAKKGVEYKDVTIITDVNDAASPYGKKELPSEGLVLYSGNYGSTVAERTVKAVFDIDGNPDHAVAGNICSFARDEERTNDPDILSIATADEGCISAVDKYVGGDADSVSDTVTISVDAPQSDFPAMVVCKVSFPLTVLPLKSYYESYNNLAIKVIDKTTSAATAALSENEVKNGSRDTVTLGAYYTDPKKPAGEDTLIVFNTGDIYDNVWTVSPELTTNNEYMFGDGDIDSQSYISELYSCSKVKLSDFNKVQDLTVTDEITFIDDSKTKISKVIKVVDSVPGIIASGIEGSTSWCINDAGALIVSGVGEFKGNLGDPAPWYDYRTGIKSASVELDGTTDMSHMFEGCSNLTSVDFSKSDMSQVRDMSYMFAGAAIFDIDFNNANFVENTSYMFSNATCKAAQTVRISNWSTSSVTDMSYMYAGTKVTGGVLYFECDTSNVMDMSHMFEDADIRGLMTGQWSTPNVTNMKRMFANSNIDLLAYDIYAGLDTSSVNDMTEMFLNCKCETLSLGGYDMSTVSEASDMFKGCSDLVCLEAPRKVNTDISLPDTFIVKDTTKQEITKLQKDLNRSNTLIKKTKESSYVPVDTITLIYSDYGKTKKDVVISGYAEPIDATLSGDYEQFNVHFVSADTRIANVVFDGVLRVIRGFNPGTTTITAFYDGMRRDIKVVVDSSLKVSIEPLAVATPVPSVESDDEIEKGTKLTVSCNTMDAKIYYVSDPEVLKNSIGSAADDTPIIFDKYGVPLEGVCLYEDGITIDESCVDGGTVSILIVAKKDGYTDGWCQPTYTLAGENPTGNVTWNIDDAGKLTVTGTGEFKAKSGDPAPWYNDRLSIKSAVVTLTGTKDFSHMFEGCTNLKTINMNGTDFSDAEDMSYMFCNSGAFVNFSYDPNDPEESDKTSKVKNMSHMYEGITTTDWDEAHLSFDTSGATDMSYMFANANGFCVMFNNADTSKVTNMSHMFAGMDTQATYLELDTRSVTDMSSMFEGAKTKLYWTYSSWDTSKVKNMSRMFANSGSVYQDIDSTGIATGIPYMSFDTSNVEDMSGMFEGCTIQTLDLSNFDMTKVTNASDMFKNCDDLIYLNAPKNIKETVTLPAAFIKRGDASEAELTTLPKNISTRSEYINKAKKASFKPVEELTLKVEEDQNGKQRRVPLLHTVAPEDATDAASRRMTIQDESVAIPNLSIGIMGMKPGQTTVTVSVEGVDRQALVTVDDSLNVTIEPYAVKKPKAYFTGSKAYISTETPETEIYYADSNYSGKWFDIHGNPMEGVSLYTEPIALANIEGFNTVGILYAVNLIFMLLRALLI